MLRNTLVVWFTTDMTEAKAAAALARIVVEFAPVIPVIPVKAAFVAQKMVATQ